NRLGSRSIFFGCQHPNVGAFGGRIEGAYETPPPEGFEMIEAFLAIRDYGPNIIAFKPENLQLPPAASLVIRRQAWVDCVPTQPILTGKLPGLFIQGDDYEPLLYIYKGNWEILYNPALKTHHQISRQRFEREYLLTLARGCGLSTCQLKLIATKSWCKPLVAFRIFIGSLRRLAIHLLRNRECARKDLVAEFQLHFHLGSLLSPFYVRRWY
ncbi:MAG: glycosyl transferase, partial [Nodosilinea sp.]